MRGNGEGHRDVEGVLATLHFQVHNLICDFKDAGINTGLFVAEHHDAVIHRGTMQDSLLQVSGA